MPQEIDFSSSLESFKRNSSTHQKIILDLKEYLDGLKLDDLGMERKFIAKIYQTLPTEVDNHVQVLGKVKDNFSDLDCLKKHLRLLPEASFYTETEYGKHDPIVLFTYVINDGLGDLRTAELVFEILKEKFYSLQQILLVHEKYRGKDIFQHEHSHVFFYTEETRGVENFPKEICTALKNAYMVIQIPSFYPHFQDLLKEFSPPLHLTVAEYGFIDSAWAHPKVEHTICMGLHFLEKGILIKNSKELESIKISQPLQNRICPNVPLEVYAKKVDFCFAYFKNLEGGCLFLHLLMEYYSESNKDIDLVCPEISLIVELIKNKSICVHSLGISKLCISSIKGNYLVPISNKGKVLRLVETGILSQNDTIALMKLSKALTVCRGNQSFTEAISLGALFFLDAVDHLQPFIKDFISVAQARIGNNELIEFLEGSLKALSLRSQWSKLQNLGIRMGELLKDPNTKRAFLSLQYILREEYRFNEGLVCLIQRNIALCKKKGSNFPWTKL